MYYYEKSYIDRVDSNNENVGGGGDNEAQCGRAGFPFMNNLSIPLGLVMRKYSDTDAYAFHSKCSGFMCESDYEKATSGTRIDRDKKTNKTKHKSYKKPLKNTRRKS